MLRRSVFDGKNWIPVSGHWDDKKKRYWYDIKREELMAKRNTGVIPVLDAGILKFGFYEKE